MKNVFIPYGSFIRGESYDEDYILAKIPEGYIREEFRNYSEISKEADIIYAASESKLKDSLAYYNILVDYNQELANVIFRNAEIYDLEEFVNINSQERIKRYVEAPSSFNLRKAIFAYAQKMAYKETGKFINYKTGLMKWADKLTKNNGHHVFFDQIIKEEVHEIAHKLFNIPILENPIYVYWIGKDTPLQEEVLDIIKDRYIALHPTAVLWVTKDKAICFRETTCSICSRGEWEILENVKITPRYNGVILNNKFINAELKERIDFSKYKEMFGKDKIEDILNEIIEG